MSLLSKEEQERLIHADHHAPRSVLGFHELTAKKGKVQWVIRVLEPEAKAVSMYWEEESPEEAQSLEQIHKGGLFEITLDPKPPLQPYLLQVTYHDGNTSTHHDPFYFSPQLTEFDCHLFNEGNHHQIYRKLGAHCIEVEGIAGTLFAVWAPNAQRVSVVGDFNYWDGRKHLMQSHGGSGIWELFIPKVQAGALYKYEVQSPAGTLLKTDPYGSFMQHPPETASVVVELDGYEWQDQSWMEARSQQDPLEQPISVYEVHLGSWKRVPEENNRYLTYREAAEQLIPYVKDLGYTHIELLPITEHPLDASWGYQVTGYFAPTSRHGSPHDLMYFIDCCHQEGLGVILDWVPAHFPKDAHGLASFDGSPLYEHQDAKQGEHQEWGTLVFNYGRHEVRNFLIASALFWLDYYHIDGIRVDAVAAMLYLDYNREEGQWIPNRYGGKENIEAIDFIRQLNATLFHYYPGILSVAEESTAWSGVSQPTYTGGLGFNLKWNMGWMNDTLRYIELDPIFRKYDHHLITFSMVYAFSENFTLPISHDEVVHGKRSLLAKMPGDEWQQRANYRLYLSFQMAHPGKQLLFMGSEFGQWDEWSEAQSLDWHLLEHLPHQQLQHCCRQLNHFYRSHEVLYTNDFSWTGFEWVDLHDHEHSVISFLRKGKEGSEAPPILFIFNFTPVPQPGYAVGVPTPGTYEKIWDSDSEEFGGSHYNQQYQLYTEPRTWQGRPCRILIDLPPLAAIALQIVDR